MDSQFQSMPPAQAQAPMGQVSAPVQPAPVVSQSKKGGKFKFLLTAIIFLLIGAAVGYMFRDSKAKTDTKNQQAQIDSVKTQLGSVATQLAEAQKKIASQTAAPAAAGVRPDTTTINNIEAAVKSGNYSALSTYAASSVTTVTSGSPAQTNRTPAQMAADLAFLKSATGTWDFNLPATTTSKYQAGQYKQYFPSTALVGKSTNNYVVSFQFDSQGKINGVLMSASESALQ